MTTERWQLDGAHSTVGFSVRHMMISKVRGSFSKFTANLALVPTDWSHSSVEAQIEVGSVDTGMADRDTHLRSPDFFDAENFPLMTFKSKSIVAKSTERLQVAGDLTIRGVTREVTLAVEYGGTGKDPWGNERVGFTATTSISRKDFGLNWNQVLETGGVLVSDRVDIELEIQAIKSAA